MDFENPPPRLAMIYSYRNPRELIDDFASTDDRNAWMSTSTRTSAVGINTAGAVSGQGSFNGVYRVFVLIPH